MTLVNNQSEYEAAVAAEDAEITLGAVIDVLTVPTHACLITMPSGTGLTGAIVNSCSAGEAVLAYGGAAYPYPGP